MPASITLLSLLHGLFPGTVLSLRQFFGVCSDIIHAHIPTPSFLVRTFAGAISRIGDFALGERPVHADFLIGQLRAEPFFSRLSAPSSALRSGLMMPFSFATFSMSAVRREKRLRTGFDVGARSDNGARIRR